MRFVGPEGASLGGTDSPSGSDVFAAEVARARPQSNEPNTFAVPPAPVVLAAVTTLCPGGTAVGWSPDTALGLHPTLSRTCPWAGASGAGVGMITGHCLNGFHDEVCPGGVSCSCFCHPQLVDIPPDAMREWARAEAAHASILPRWELDQAFSTPDSVS